MQWSQRHKIQVGHPHIEPPNSMTTEGNKTTLNVDPRTLSSADGSNEWLMYNFTRVASQTSDFAKNYPNEQGYRHSLKEEAAALRMVAEACAKDLKSGKVKTLEPSLETLVKLNDAGLLEAFILFARPDQDRPDYAAYRATNRDKLRRYWVEVAIIGIEVVPCAGGYLTYKLTKVPPATAGGTDASLRTTYQSYSSRVCPAQVCAAASQHASRCCKQTPP